MAISLSRHARYKHATEASKKIAEQAKRAQDAENKRKGRSGLLGKVGGFLAGQALSSLGSMALMGLTGGAINPLTLKLLTTGLKGVGMTAGKAGAHQATVGKWGKALKSPGQVGGIKAGPMGYGKEEARTLSQDLAAQRESQIGLDTLGGDVVGALAAEFGADLGGKFMEKTGLSDKLARTTGYGGEEYGAKVSEQFFKDNPDFLEDADDFWDLGPHVFGSEDTYKGLPFEQNLAQGGQVMDQNALMKLAMLSQMPNQQQTTYDDTPLEEVQSTIAEYFASNGKTLGGSNTKSLSQMLGKQQHG